ncbi:MAG: AarF/ABC1/UbiB kinase family protein, partial [Rhodospirillales bacterium]|nr:AarF/ABC1/UbiB kinase family protein [Rhodospirillales bacterium]
LIFSIYQRYDRSVETKNIHSEIADRLREELDYEREAKHMALYAKILAKEPGVHVPEVVSDLSTKRLLTMSWLDGEPLMTIKDADLETRNAIAYNLFRAWYVPFYDYGVIHGDPHLGNYTVRPDQSINLLDYGCVRIFKGHFVKGVIDLYHALKDGDEALAVSAYEGWGFKDLNREVIDVLNMWARYVYAPLIEDRERRIQDGSTGAYGHEVAQEVHGELRRLGGVRPPREFVFVDRAAIGLGSVFMHLKAEINWHRMFETLIEGFDVKALDRRQNQALKAVGLPAPH